MFPFCLHGDDAPVHTVTPAPPTPAPVAAVTARQDADSKEREKRLAFDKRREVERKMREHGSECSHIWAFHTHTF